MSNPPGSNPTAPNNQKKLKILVMDDEITIQKLLKRVLEKNGYAVTLVENGEKAVAAYRQAMGEGVPFAGVIMDLIIPGGMGGREAIRHLLKLDPAVKAIVSSGYSDSPVMADYRSYGFSGLVPKPYQLSELMSVIEAVLKEDNAPDL